MKKLIFFLFLFIPLIINAQSFYIAPAFGFSQRNFYGHNIIADSIVAYPQKVGNMRTALSVNFGQQIYKNLSYRSSLTAHGIYVGYVVYNRYATGIFAPVEKVSTVGAFSLNLNFAPEIEIPLKYNFVFSIFGGMEANFNFRYTHPDVSFRNGTVLTGVAELINNLDDSFKPVYFGYLYGASLSWKQIVLSAQLSSVFPQGSITKEIVYFNKSYPFKNQVKTINIMLSYRFTIKKRKQK